MIRRILSLFLACCLVCSCLTVPAMAAELESGHSLINVMDYADNWVYYSDSSGLLTVDVPLPFSARIFYVDAVFWSTSSLFTASYVTNDVGSVLTVENLGDNYYRVYGNTHRHVVSSAGFQLQYQGTGIRSIQLVSFYVSQTSYMQYDTPSTLTLGSQSVTQSSGSSYVTLSEDVTVLGSAGAYYGGITTYEWNKYDYMSFQLVFSAVTLNAISVVLDGTAVPFDISYVEGNLPDYNASWSESSTSGQPYVISGVTVVVDLTNADRTSTNPLQITFSGTGFDVDVSLGSSVGLIASHDGFTEMNWLQKIWKSLEDGFQSVVDAITGDTSSSDAFNDEVQEELGELEENQNIIDSMTEPDLEGEFGDLSFDADAGAGISFIGDLFSEIYSGPFALLFFWVVLISMIGYLLYGRR